MASSRDGLCSTSGASESRRSARRRSRRHGCTPHARCAVPRLRRGVAGVIHVFMTNARIPCSRGLPGVYSRRTPQFDCPAQKKCAPICAAPAAAREPAATRQAIVCGPVRFVMRSAARDFHGSGDTGTDNQWRGV